MTTALYRRYRPETFEDVIGQSHVTEPLMTALRKNKVSHAYLFSGPRGCGKTTSARILARCLNCAQGPTATPCGTCQSCQDLARDGAGSLDVIEMDAASHGGVDDARQLRERATFAPVRDRYKIFIIDEAHMVTRDGFNALLKIVEEPPEHIKFIFATTEPSKVLPTIRSRTHHYPFRLVPPEPLMDYLNALCEQERVGVEPGVQAMVVRAGGGSVRDSLSVLDQLMAGTDGDHIGYDLASSLLGYTHGALLDDVVDAFASGDAATVFRAVDRVIQTGQDPRRFVEDLLERFRDLVIVDAVPDTAGNILHGTPEDQISRLRNQAQLMGAAELSRAADITNEALTEMVGATSPQLHLELLCARLLLPSTEDTTRGVAVRVDRLERRLGIGRTGTAAGHPPEAPAAAAQPAAAPQGAGSQGTGEQDPASPDDERRAPQPASAQPATTRPASDQPAASGAETHSTGPAQPGQPEPSTRAAEQQTPPRTDDGADDEARDETADGTGGSGQQPPAPVEGGFGKYRDHRPQPRAADGSAASAASTPPQTEGVRPTGSASESVPQQSTRTPDQTPEQPPHADQSRAQGPASGGEIDMIRNSWTEVVSTLAEIHRVSWMTVMRGTPVAFDGSVLQLLFDGEGDRKNFPRFEPNLVQAIQQVIGVSCHVEAIGPGGGGHRGGGARPGDAGGPPEGTDAPSPRESGPQHPVQGQVRDRARGQAQGQAPRRAEHPVGERRTGPAGSGQDRTGSAQPTAADGGRATGPRPLQDSGSSESRPAHRPEEEADPDGADESGDFSTWDVAPIPGGAPAQTPSDDASAGPVPSAAIDPTPPSPPRPEETASSETVSSSGPTPSSEASAPPQGRVASAQRTEPQGPGQSPSTPRRVSPPDDRRARGQERTRPSGRSAAPQRRSGEEPSPDAPVPLSPYDDIPWPDEPPPEDEPPYEEAPPPEDTGQRPGAPAPRASASAGSPAAGPDRPSPAAPAAGLPSTDASAGTAHDQRRRPEGEPGSADGSGAGSGAGPDQGEGDGPDAGAGDPDETPPEQWRPSALAAPAATRSPSRPEVVGVSSTTGAAAPSPAAGAAATNRRLSFRERHAAQIAAAQGRPGSGSRDPDAGLAPGADPDADLESESSFSPSEDDEAVENSSVGGRAVIERILGARLLEEIPREPGTS